MAYDSVGDEDDLEEFNFKMRCVWPFKDMQIGQTVRFEHPDYTSKAQHAAHTHGNKSGKKFQTQHDGPHVVVKRIS